MATTPSEYSGVSDFADPGYLDSGGNQAKGGNGQKRYPIDASHVVAAWSYINMPKNQKGYTPEQLSAIKGRIKAAMKRHGHDVSDDDGDETSQRVTPLDLAGVPGGPVEERAARLDNVDFGQRILTLLAVPYEQPTRIEYRGEVWHEVFARSSFEGLPLAKRRIPVSAVLRAPAYDHVDGHLVGTVAEVFPNRSEGLVLDVRISDTPAGNETLQLAHDDVLSPSIGFAASGRDQTLDRRSMVRRIHRAKLDHLSMVPTPAYDGARVLAMRDGAPPVSARDLPPLSSPNLDEFLADPVFQWVDERLSRD